MSAGLDAWLRRLEGSGDAQHAAVVPVVVYRPGEDHDAAIRRVFGTRPLPPTLVLIPDNGRDPTEERP